jgi:hypothetical protein
MCKKQVERERVIVNDTYALRMTPFRINSAVK